jgi:SpoVK/Ycf46/Vps4 family AAA+-type ATPase
MSDGGTTSRVFGTFLTWMQDKKASAFVVATSNDVTALPPELLRKGRFDEIFFIDLPSEQEREQIFRIHLKKRKRNPDDFEVNRLAKATPGFSGAEIEAAVVESLYDAFDDQKPLTTDSILFAVRNSIPLAMTMQERIEGLRQWAEERARAASSVQSEDLQTIREELIIQKHQALIGEAEPLPADAVAVSEEVAAPVESAALPPSP